MGKLWLKKHYITRAMAEPPTTQCGCVIEPLWFYLNVLYYERYARWTSNMIPQRTVILLNGSGSDSDLAVLVWSILGFMQGRGDLTDIVNGYIVIG